jgi:hypothetical protein
MASGKTHIKRPKLERLAEADATVAVVGGDEACIRALVRHWTGRPAARVLRASQAIRLLDATNRRSILVINKSATPKPWPGGPLVWLFPERGPSEPDLAQLRWVLAANAANCPVLRVLLCLPFDVSPGAAAKDLDIVAETLRWAVDPGVEMEIEAVWLFDAPESTLGSWLDKLR